MINRLIKITAFVSLLFLTFFITKFVSAAIEGEGLTISPPISELTIDEGDSLIQTIRLTNPTDKLVEVYPRVMNFRAAGEGGEPDFYDEGDDASKFSLAKWISFNQSKIALAPEQVVEFKYTINVPQGAEPGGHYGVIFFATQPPENKINSSQVSLGSMIGSLILAKVPGQIVEKAFIEDFKTDKKIYITSPVKTNLRISNLGNVHFKPYGSITISGWYQSPKNKININEQKGNVLPDSTRKFTNEVKFSPWSFGYFKALAEITYGENEKILLAEYGFWLVPVWLIVLIVILPIVIVYFFLKYKKGNKKKNYHGKVVDLRK